MLILSLNFVSDQKFYPNKIKLDKLKLSLIIIKSKMMIMQQVDSVVGSSTQIPKNRLIMLVILAFLYIAVTTLNSYLHFVHGVETSLGLDGRPANTADPIKKKYRVVKNQIAQCTFAKTFDETLQTEQNPNSKSYIVDKSNQKFYDLPLSERTTLGHIRPPTHKVTFWVLNKRKNTKQPTNDHNTCYFSNGINMFTQKSVRAIKSLLEAFEPFHKIIIALDDQDLKNIDLLRDQLGAYIREHNSVQFDSDYRFITDVAIGCNSFVYGFGNFVIDSSMANNILEQAKKLSNLSLIHSSVYFQKKAKKTLQPISQASLQSVRVADFYRYLYILDPQLFKIITPLNFAYYSKYSLQQMLLFPILAILQQSPNIKVSNKIMHGVEQVFLQQEQFILQAPPATKNAFCFVSYPNDPYEPVYKDAAKYLSVVGSQQVNDADVSVVLSAPYAYKKSKPLFQIAKELLQFKNKNSNFRVRFRVRANKTVSSLAVYEASYSYCPSKSMMISTRHNIDSMNTKLLDKLKEVITLKYHYYFVNVLNDKKQLTSFKQKLVFGKNRQTRTSPIFQQKLKHIQIFKSDLLKSNIFWMLKNEQLDFYETESSFVTHMMESIKLQIFIINETMVKIYTRNQTALEKVQIENVKKFAQFGALPADTLIPYRHNCLENIAFRRFAPQKMQRNIHQIWFGKDIPPLRMKLHYTIKNMNKDFNTILWTRQNITREVAPFTYKLVHRTLEFHKESKTSMYAMAADLLRYEVVLRHGGIYIDFKMEGLRPLNNYLKYEVFFVDYDIQSIRFGSPRAVGNPIFAGVKNNYHLNYVLTEIINEYTVPMRPQINVITGGFAVRKSINEQELFNWVGVGYHLIIPLPYETTANACGGFNKTFDLDQQIVQLRDIDSQKIIKFGIPCREYPEAYLVPYEPLGRTWVRPKSFAN